jgi:4-amino-4-deoxy-L-arabinose transferase-like glycosyltransferase
VVFLFFSLSGSKLIPYILPIFPALSIVLGRLFTREWGNRVHRNGEGVLYSAFFLVVAVGGFAAGSGFLAAHLPDLPEMAVAAGSLRGLAFGASIVAFVMLVLFAFGRFATYGALFCGLGAFSAAVAMGLTLYTPVIDGFNTTKDLARAIIETRQADAAIVNFATFDETLPFYTKRRIYVADYEGELEMGSQYADARPFFLDTDGLLRLFRSDRPVFVVCRGKRLSRLRQLGIEGAGAAVCQDDRCVIANRPVLGR